MEQNPTPNPYARLISALTEELVSHGIKVTWIPEFSPHMWDYSTDINHRDEIGTKLGRKWGFELADELRRCFAVPKPAGCLTNESGCCPDQMTLMMHVITEGPSTGTTMIYYSPECSEHGFRAMGKIVSVTVGL